MTRGGGGRKRFKPSRDTPTTPKNRASAAKLVSQRRGGETSLHTSGVSSGKKGGGCRGRAGRIRAGDKGGTWHLKQRGPVSPGKNTHEESERARLDLGAIDSKSVI